MEPLLKKNQSDGQTFPLSHGTPHSIPGVNPEAVEHDRHPHNRLLQAHFHKLRSRKYYLSLQFSDYNFVYIFVSP